MDWDYIRSKTKQLNLATSQAQQNDLLYRIGSHANLITFEDVSQLRGGQLTPAMRSRVLTWLRRNANDLGLTLSH